MNISRTMGRWWVSAAIFTLVSVATMSAAKLPELTIYGGEYSGNCINTTHRIKAALRVFLRTRGTDLSGEVSISSPLFGGGIISGKKEGSKVTFVSAGEDFGQITWFGKLAGKSIAGTYHCELPDGSVQEGTWEVSRR